MKKISIFLSFLLALSITGCTPSTLSTPFAKNVKKEYFTGGRVRSELIMENGSPQNGILKKYGYDGKLTSVVHIANGVKNGTESWYDKHGRILMKVPYVNGRKHGVKEAYYPNGDVMISTTFVNGVKDGEAMTYRRDGSLHQKVTFKNGKIIR
jgi:antitoxin component YwqK of YwqJK toxin-antitoxin module